MTGKADFTTDEWNLVREGPPNAGLIVLMAASGGSFRESWALAKTFAEARKQQGASELVDALFAYVANTVSFIRIAAFAAVHAGLFVAMFAVTDTLAETRAHAYPVPGAHVQPV